jgi:Flp pilus assembly pilin Flp
MQDVEHFLVNTLVAVVIIAALYWLLWLLYHAAALA